MRIVTVASSRGVAWIGEGFVLFRRQPIALGALTVLYLLSLVLSKLLPLVGGFAPLLLTPLLSVGLMRAIRDVDEGRGPPPKQLYSGAWDDGGRAWPRLLMLGVGNSLAAALSLFVSSLVDGGALVALTTGEGPDSAPAHPMSMAYGLIVFTLLYTPSQMALWFAPMFTGWLGIAPAKAAFFSLIAVWRNRGAFLRFALAWMALAAAFSVLTQVLMLASGAQTLVVVLLVTPITLTFLTVLYCSFWPSYRDIVIEGDATSSAPSDPAPAPDGPA